MHGQMQCDQGLLQGYAHVADEGKSYQDALRIRKNILVFCICKHLSRNDPTISSWKGQRLNVETHVKSKLRDA